MPATPNVCHENARKPKRENDITPPSSPEDTRISIPYTSPSANVTVSKSFFCPSFGLRMMRFFPSITFCVCWHDNIPVRVHHATFISAFLYFRDPRGGRASKTRHVPSTGLQSHAAATLPTASVTCQFLLPTRTRRIATSAAVHAARSTSARRPVTGLSGVAPRTIVSAEIAANPSMCAPRCTFTTSPLTSFCVESGSELRAVAVSGFG